MYEGNNNNCDEDLQCNERVKYKSKARIVLVGSGADEQCAGYGRHKTKYRKGRYAFFMNKLNNLVTFFFACLKTNLCEYSCARVSVCVVQWLLGFTNRNCVLLLYVLVLVPVWHPVLKSSLFLKTSLFSRYRLFKQSIFRRPKK